MVDYLLYVRFSYCQLDRIPRIYAEGAVRAQRVLREYAEVVCSRQMGLFITYEDDDSKATRRNKTANTTKRFQICSDSAVSAGSVVSQAALHDGWPGVQEGAGATLL